MIRRFGRPGLIGLAARTAVVAGTATAVSGGILAHRQRQAQTAYEAAQYEAAQRQSVQQLSTPPQAAAQQNAAADLGPTAPAAATTATATTATAADGDLVAKLQQLGALRTQGILSADEFESAKARLLS
ncbi:SHOCT domain-containing protein [Leucobacter luti]|uniref:SHOCT domain-containing protein n=1 Tax=Leucobacter luti TaxID=340320 RepID=UPI001C68A119|nr:SHOCT domain-containing protein [Leucobacter luti]QYM76848.1 SHOCT domain-containing protein [Leucobacter luti]